MSDLIIKPSGTSANFKVLNPSGTDKIVMNSSGTITTGTLGSAVTFPAGHVLQVVQNENTENNSLTTSYANIYEVSITLKSASSDVYGFFYLQYRMVTSAGFGIEIYRNNSATVTTSHTAVWTKNVISSSTPNTWFTGNGAEQGVGTINPKDSLSGFSIGDTLYYGLFARKTDSDAVEIGRDADTDGFISSTLMEVQK